MTPEEMEKRIEQLESDMKLMLSQVKAQDRIINQMVQLIGKLVSFHIKPPKPPEDVTQCMYQ